MSKKITIQLGKLETKFLFKAIALAVGYNQKNPSNEMPFREKEYLLKIADQLWDIYVEAYGLPTKDEIGYEIPKTANRKSQR